MLQLVEPTVKALDILESRYYNGPMTPELGYDLVLAATDDADQARNVKVQLLLNSMPKLPNQK
jgi:hypothetical protein